MREAIRETATTIVEVVVSSEMAGALHSSILYARIRCGDRCMYMI